MTVLWFILQSGSHGTSTQDPWVQLVFQKKEKIYALSNSIEGKEASSFMILIN